MATIGGQDYTNFRAVNLRGSTVLRLQGTDVGGTLIVDHIEADRAWSFPDKSGRFPIMGTFAVQLPSIASTTSIQSTTVTVTGVRAEDGLAVWLNRGVSAGYGSMGATSGGTARILAYADPGAGNITLTFFNLGVATGYVELIASYSAVR
jgi:hypothetical protein